MPRWEHGSQDRLKRAAMELFEEQGFERTTAVQIAERAGVTTRTFFRYFADKQEVLFVDAEMLRDALVEEIRRADDVGQPLVTVTRALAAFHWESLGSRESQRLRHAMIASNPVLLQRDLIKQQLMADAFTDALRRRGVDPDTAGLAARVGVEVFRTAYREWMGAHSDVDLVATTEAVLSELAAIVPAGSPRN